MATSAPIKERDPIGGLTSILNLYGGNSSVSKSGPTTSTSTNSSNLTPEMVEEMISQAMKEGAGTNSLASKGTGLYNSTAFDLSQQELARKTDRKSVV